MEVQEMLLLLLLLPLLLATQVLLLLVTLSRTLHRSWWHQTWLQGDWTSQAPLITSSTLTFLQMPLTTCTGEVKTVAGHPQQLCMPSPPLSSMQPLPITIWLENFKAQQESWPQGRKKVTQSCTLHQATRKDRGFSASCPTGLLSGHCQHAAACQARVKMPVIPTRQLVSDHCTGAGH
jgi:hypothetical protein